MTAKILDGKALAQVVRDEIREAAARFVDRHGRKPGLHVVRVGEDPASVVYTRSKEKASLEVGMAGRLHELAHDTSERDLLALLDALNADDTVDAILVQLPLPPHISADVVLDRVDPAKDVDGFHPLNAGLLASGRPGLVPCTPLGCMRLLALAQGKGAFDGVGLHAVVVGRSNIVGKPMAQLLLAANATVTIAHSRTKDLPAMCREADVLVAAVGRPELVRGPWIKPGALVVDVGINRVEGEGGKSRLVGDVAFAEAVEVAGALSPVPGGVGPLTIAHLLENTLRAAEARAASSR